jgi:TRAP-type C4-dicarboxylate transport system permease large subunit
MMLLVIGGIFFATILIGVPIAFGMGLAGTTWVLFFQGMESTILARRFYYALNSFPLLAIPLFIMLGMLADRARMLPHLVVWLQMILGRLRGGMAYINVVAAMLFAGISGTAVSDIASLGRTLIQLMTRAGYPVTYSAALTSATSIIGPIIPPSVAMIIYALAVGNVSVGAMFAGGAVPGFLFGGGFIIMAWFKTRRGKYGVVQAWPSAADFFRQTLRVLPLLALPLIIVGGIFGGVFTVTESAAVGVAYTVLVGFLSKPRLRLKDIYDATLYSALISSVLLVLGMLMDAVPIMIALAPLLAPIARQFGISDIQFGLVFVVTCLIGLVTPPVGIILFMTSSIAGVKLEPLSIAVFPFVVWMTAVVILMVFFPPLTLWLPKLVGL